MLPLELSMSCSTEYCIDVINKTNRINETRLPRLPSHLNKFRIWASSLLKQLASVFQYNRCPVAHLRKSRFLALSQHTPWVKSKQASFQDAARARNSVSRMVFTLNHKRPLGWALQTDHTSLIPSRIASETSAIGLIWVGATWCLRLANRFRSPSYCNTKFCERSRKQFTLQKRLADMLQYLHNLLYFGPTQGAQCPTDTVWFAQLACPQASATATSLSSGCAARLISCRYFHHSKSPPEIRSLSLGGNAYILSG